MAWTWDGGRRPRAQLRRAHSIDSIGDHNARGPSWRQRTPAGWPPERLALPRPHYGALYGTSLIEPPASVPHRAHQQQQQRQQELYPLEQHRSARPIERIPSDRSLSFDGRRDAFYGRRRTYDDVSSHNDEEWRLNRNGSVGWSRLLHGLQLYPALLLFAIGLQQLCGRGYMPLTHNPYKAQNADKERNASVLAAVSGCTGALLVLFVSLHHYNRVSLAVTLTKYRLVLCLVTGILSIATIAFGVIAISSFPSNPKPLICQKPTSLDGNGSPCFTWHERRTNVALIIGASSTQLILAVFSAIYGFYALTSNKKHSSHKRATAAAPTHRSAYDNSVYRF